jgi:hypothetical protein
MFRNGFTAFMFTGCLVTASAASATPVLVTSPNSDGSKYAITYSLESSNATTAVYDITLWADTSGNTLGNQTLDSVAVGINLGSGTVDSVLDASPTGDWTGMPGGLGNAGCNGTGAFVCAKAGTFLPTPSITLYSWTWDINVPVDFVFSPTGDVKVSYNTINGHNVSDQFAWQAGSPPEVQQLAHAAEPASLLLLSSGLIGAAAFLRRKFIQ